MTDIDDIATRVDQAQTVLDGIPLLIDGVLASENRLLDERDELAAKLDAETARAAQLQAELDRLKATHTPSLVLGLCPQKGLAGFTDRAGNGVVARTGPGHGIRLFGGLFDNVAPRPKEAAHVAASWKFGEDLSRRTTPAAATRAFANLVAGDSVTRHHEIDMDYRALTSQTARDEFLARADIALSEFAEVAADVRPDLVSTLIVTGWLFSPSARAPGLAARNAWGPIARKHKAIGVDFDGVHGWPYPDYTRHLPNLLAFMDKFEIEWFSAPEVGWSRNVEHDPTGSIRMDKLGEFMEACAATGRCLSADAFVYEMTVGNDFTAAELARWLEIAKAVRS